LQFDTFVLRYDMLTLNGSENYSIFESKNSFKRIAIFLKMKLVNLDNEVYFKKVFSDKEVFTAFVKDITGVTVEVDKIETEKQLERKVGPIKFKLDIFAESVDHRVIIEIQKVDYDYNFNRFMHYFLASLIDLQRDSKTYNFKKEVYTIIVITAPYVAVEKSGEILKDDVLISSLNPRTLQGLEREMYGHKLVFLNPNYISEDTPQSYLDWLNLIRESVKNPQNPNINLENPAIRKASELADLNEASPEELQEAKDEEMRKEALVAYERHYRREGLEQGRAEGKAEGRMEGRIEGIEAGKMEEKIEGIKKALQRGKLTPEEIAEDFEVPLEMVLKIQKEM